MKRRFISLILLLALLVVSVAAAGEQAAGEYFDIRFVVNGEEVIPTDSDGNPVRPVIIDGILYIPVGTIPSALGLPFSYAWKANYQEYSYEGESEGYILFRNEGGFTDKPDDSWKRIACYECAVPPADLCEGDQLVLPVTIFVRDTEKGSKVEYVNTGIAKVYASMIKGGTQMTDKNGVSDNTAAVPGSIGMTTGDGDWTVTFEGEVFGALVAGTTANIEFWCEAGTFTWEYEYVIPEQ